MDASLWRNSLGRLLPHVDASRIALTGGLAIELHLGARHAHSHDIDLVASSTDVVRVTVTDEFLVSHFHLPQPGYQKFLIQLVDPRTRLRIDIFPDTSGTLSRAQCLTDTLPVLVLDAADILDHKLATLAKSSPIRPEDPKHYEDALRLAAHLGRDVPLTPATHLAAGEFSRDVDIVCDRCTASTSGDFPLADKRAIISLLGYV